MSYVVSGIFLGFLENKFSGFVTSKSAEKLANMTRQEVIDKLLEQLDEMFSNKTAHGLLGIIFPPILNNKIKKKLLLILLMMKPKLIGKIQLQALF